MRIRALRKGPKVKDKIPACIGIVFALTAAGMLGRVVAAFLQPAATTMSMAAEVGPADDQKKHALHQHPEHPQPEERSGSAVGAVGLTGQAAGFAQGTMAPGISVAL
jgi:hypothetical protein